MVDAPNVDRRFGWAGLAIVALGLFLRLYYIAVAEVDQPLRADAAQYFQIALNVRNFSTFSSAVPTIDGVAPDSYRAPGYPALIALLSLIFGSNENTYWAILVLQSLLGAATVALTLLLALRIMSVPWAYAAALLTAIWPHLITLGGYVLTETVFGFLVLLSSYALVLMFERNSWRSACGSGVALAAAALVNQIILGLSVPLVVLVLLSRRSLLSLVFALIALGPPAAWIVRGELVESRGTLTGSGRLMDNLLTGMEPDFVPHYKADGNTPAAVAARQRISDGQRVFAKDPTLALAEIPKRFKSEPERMAAWYLSKPARFWAWSVLQGYGDVYVYPMLVAPFDIKPVLRVVASFCHGLNFPVMIGAACGMFTLLVFGKHEKSAFKATSSIALSVFAYATVVHSVLNPDARYAVPFRPFEFILAMFAASALFHRALQARNSAALPRIGNGR